MYSSFRMSLSDNVSQEELAYSASLHNTYIGQLERGEKNATIESLTKIYMALEITLEELFDDKESHQKVLCFELEEMVRLLEGRSKKEQRAVLNFIESLIAWKDNE
ncbi:helix-turn-helix domain-containing protein [Lysinibacillus sp. Ag94]|uniref:helix-turn-helix domain-containing protein n=1 Tax=Lysinibacillus sp. Ag94 TaxID=2936682 RepID=UPI00200FEE26|nr:helix-turn-helix transcriptional regulator [Lysinibacillus sp. Ag94]UPW82643.1 helix-turn-helix transcriptional regulator [Lysinibacillus sp. Ag94]